jgi:hypothetical protein
VAVSFRVAVSFEVAVSFKVAVSGAVSPASAAAGAGIAPLFSNPDFASYRIISSKVTTDKAKITNNMTAVLIGRE